MLNKKIKNLKIDNFKLEQNVKHKCNYGVAWVSSSDQYSLEQLIKLHYNVSFFFVEFYYFLQVYAGYRIRTYIIGVAYDSEEDLYEDHPQQKSIDKFTKKNIKSLNILKKYLEKFDKDPINPETKD